MQQTYILMVAHWLFDASKVTESIRRLSIEFLDNRQKQDTAALYDKDKLCWSQNIGSLIRLLPFEKNKTIIIELSNV